MEILVKIGFPSGNWSFQAEICRMVRKLNRFNFLVEILVTIRFPSGKRVLVKCTSCTSYGEAIYAGNQVPRGNYVQISGFGKLALFMRKLAISEGNPLKSHAGNQVPRGNYVQISGFGKLACSKGK